MVKLATTLPKEHEHNGLEPNTRHLLSAYTGQDYLPVVALIRTKEITQTEDFERVPKVEVVAIELAVDEEDAEAVRELLQILHDARVAHIKQPLDLPDTDDDGPDVSDPLAIEAAEIIVDAEVVDDDSPLALTGQGA